MRAGTSTRAGWPLKRGKLGSKRDPQTTGMKPGPGKVYKTRRPQKVREKQGPVKVAIETRGRAWEQKSVEREASPSRRLSPVQRPGWPRWARQLGGTDWTGERRLGLEATIGREAPAGACAP